MFSFVHLYYFCLFTKICLFIFFNLLMVLHFRTWNHIWFKREKKTPFARVRYMYMHGFSWVFLFFFIPFTTSQFWNMLILKSNINIFRLFFWLSKFDHYPYWLNTWLNYDNIFIGLCMQIIYIYIRKLKKNPSFIRFMTVHLLIIHEKTKFR